MNIGMHVSLSILISSVCMPSSGIVDIISKVRFYPYFSHILSLFIIKLILVKKLLFIYFLTAMDQYVSKIKHNSMSYNLVILGQYPWLFFF